MYKISTICTLSMATSLCILVGCVSSFTADRYVIDPYAAQPVDELPLYVKAPDNQVTLFADYNGAKAGSISLYIVNRTDQPVTIPTQDANPFIKLEARYVAGNWKRAQGHVYSWCGNSYANPPVLPSGFFYTLQALYPAEGEACQVRYRMFSSLALVSNEGKGKVNPEAIEACKYDEMAILFGDVDLLREVLLGNVTLTRDSRQELPISAVRQLRKFDSKEIEPILRNLRVPRTAIDSI